MIYGLVALTQAGLLVLLVALVWRMLVLARSEPLLTRPEPLVAGAGHQSVQVARTEKPVLRQQKRQTSTDRTELLTHLHILAGLQERDCRISGLELSQAPEAVRAYAAVWLYGAGCALCGQSERHSDALAGLVAQIANRKTGIRQAEAVQAIATLTSCGVLLACFRAGLEGAEYWQGHQYVQPENSLYAAITANALI
ncbi:hypothetical protein SAMN04488490_0965 [Marinobacter sp. LV10R510-11A]|uniref:hypothetical protein n=1 Tax=Marinobacter sp. LV10R510-11A TaxID=1415568 RepID=UPI000BB85B5E|nr:hypothetical protein [Marinobacter sp. LV10R510-11A]SOB75381.1 hypothetical protein SAMN04488490_0965 [Marinobacter sp. LV10R510-11A]